MSDYNWYTTTASTINGWNWTTESNTRYYTYNPVSNAFELCNSNSSIVDYWQNIIVVDRKKEILKNIKVL